MVRFNVGGRIFETTATTFTNAGWNSLFGAIFYDNWDLQPCATATTKHFIDRNPDCFAVLLDLLRLGELQIPPNILEKLLYREVDIGAPIMDERKVRDAIAMDDTNSICVVNEYEDLGFMDFRFLTGSVRWSSRSRLMKGKMLDEPCYPKVALRFRSSSSSFNYFGL